MSDFFSGKKILLGLTGGVAAYKVARLGGRCASDG